LRNQYFSLQHGADQGVYVPSSDSDLYKVEVDDGGNTIQQPFPNLFYVPKMTTKPPPNELIMKQNLFFNNTKSQLKSIMLH
jgi:hypothetical protein